MKDVREDFKYISMYHEWRLACEMEVALRNEDYEYCEAIQTEVDKRIENNTINKSLMDGFKYYDPQKASFVGEPSFGDTNGLFNKYNYE